MSIERHPAVEPADPALLARLRTIPVALLSDQVRRNRGIAGLRPYHRAAPLAGTALTVRTRAGDNLAILRAFDLCRPGHVMVVAAEGECANALVGGILCLFAETIGLAGLVLDGAVRDVAELASRDFPAWARGHTHRGPYKDGPGAINVAIAIGGQPIRPGDLVVGDADGLLVLSAEEVEAVIAGAEAQRAREEATVGAIRAGNWDRSFVDALECRAARY